MVIQSITKVRNKNKCQIVFDDGTFIEVYMDLILKHRLIQGSEFSRNDFEVINKENRTFELKQTAYNFASYKQRTEKQVTTKLAEKGFSPEEAKKAIEFLKKFALLDDVQFAKNFITSSLQKKSAGKRKIYFDLLNKGISKEVAQSAIDNNFKDEDSFELAMKAAEKKLKILVGKPPEKRKQSLITFLNTRGFDWPTVKKTVETILNEDSF